MDYQKNLKYFKSTDTHYYIGLVLMALGGIFFVMAYIFWTYLFPYQDILGIGLLIVGAIVAFIPASLRSSEKDIDEAVLNVSKNYEETVKELPISRQLAANLSPILTGAYTYEDDAKIRRGKIDRKHRSDRYAVSVLLFTKYGVCICEKRFSLTKAAETETTKEFHYADIDQITIESELVRFASGETVPLTYLVIRQNDEIKGRIPASPGTVTEATLTAVNTYIQRAKK